MDNSCFTTPQNVWDAATGSLGCNDLDDYLWGKKRQSGIEPDWMTLGPKEAERLHDIGLANPQFDADCIPLPFFEVDVFFTDGRQSDDQDERLNMDEPFGSFQPERPYRSDMAICAVYATFVAHKDFVDCKINLSDCNDSGGGDNDIGVVMMRPIKDNGFFTIPMKMNENKAWAYDYRSISNISRWLGFLWLGIQHRMMMAIQSSGSTPRSLLKDEKWMTGTQSGEPGRERVTIIRLTTHKSTQPEETGSSRPGSHHKITLEAWGVRGHFRTCHSGKRSWVKAHTKGRRRNEISAYSPKEYRFEEGTNGR